MVGLEARQTSGAKLSPAMTVKQLIEPIVLLSVHICTATISHERNGLGWRPATQGRFPQFLALASRDHSYRDRIRGYLPFPSDRDLIIGLDAGRSGEPDQDIRQWHFTLACDRRRPLAAHVEHAAVSDDLETLAVRDTLAA